MNIDITKSTPIEGCKRVYSLNGKYKHQPKRILCKYLPFKRLKASVDTKRSKIKLTFVTPNCWSDPFEVLFVDRKPAELEVACFCVVDDDVTTNSAEAIWNAYPATGDKLIRVGYNSSTLFSLLDSYAEEKDVYFFIANIEYSMSREGLLDLHKRLSKESNKSSIEDYLSLMSYKRKAFEYEHETRIFMVSNKTTSERTDVELALDDSLIEKVTIAPIRPFAYDDPRKETYKELCDTENKAYADALRKFLPNIKVYRSTIYELKNNEAKKVRYTALK